MKWKIYGRQWGSWGRFLMVLRIIPQKERLLFKMPAMDHATRNNALCSTTKEVRADDHPLPSPREREIFDAAVEISTPEERAAYLNRAWGQDHKLRESIESLLQHHFEEDSLAGFADAFRSSIVKSEVVGDKIGNYKLLGKIGEGGCGVVYLAEQTEPFQRKVALKIIKVGMNTKQMIRRFVAEWEALAKLNHANIAKVYDAGSTKEGRPYYVMEFVSGERITNYADSHRLTIDQRLELFAKVCLAVHHAHANGFIHRDLKPSNILVTEENGEPFPKIIDFGIAKAINEAEGVNKNAFTVTSHFIGTPSYASPEQAECLGEQIDKRADVYSLGVILHELLIGCLPFTLDGLGLKQQVQSSSAQFTSLAKTEISKIAGFRKTEPHNLLNALRADLDPIVLKCLEKKPENRYQTANILAYGIQDYLRKQEFAKNDKEKNETIWKFKKTAFACGVGIICLLLFIGVAHLRSSSEKNARNKEVFLKSEDALKLPIGGALAIVCTINAKDISDDDLSRYISFYDSVVALCVDAGIKNNGVAVWPNIKYDNPWWNPLKTSKISEKEFNERFAKLNALTPQFNQLHEKLKHRYVKKNTDRP